MTSFSKQAAPYTATSPPVTIKARSAQTAYSRKRNMRSQCSRDKSSTVRAGWFSGRVQPDKASSPTYTGELTLVPHLCGVLAHYTSGAQGEQSNARQQGYIA